jgi:DNA-binding transcriptional ArsR family regulator
MVIFEFGIEDLARLRFAISPMWEVVASLRRLRDPSAAGPHLPWIDGLRGRLGGIELGPALHLTPARGYVPDFMSPPPTTPLARFEDEIELVRASPARQVRRDMELLLGGRPAPPVLEPFLSSPVRSVKRLADQLERYWAVAIEPHWPRVRALLEADLAHRARRLTEGGPAALFPDLHRSVGWRGGAVHVDVPHDGVTRLEGRGLLLVPSAFSWISPATIDEEPWQPTLIYPARGVAALWEPPAERSPEAVARVIGRTRAGLLARLQTPQTTTALAARTGLRAGGVSQHLTALRDAGLVSATRQGRAVLYVRTDLADALLTGARSPA